MADTRVVVLRSYDPLLIDLAEAQLRAADIPCTRVGRGNAALLGAGNSIVEQQLEVDARNADAARELLASAHSAEAGEEQEPPADATSQRAARPRREAFVAAALSMLWPGLGLSYVGFYLTGLVLGAWSFVALIRASMAPDGLALALFGHLLPRVIDLVGAQLWLRRFGRSKVPFLHQAALALAIVGTSSGAQRLLGPGVTQLLATLHPDVPQEGWPFEESALTSAVSDARVTEDGAPILLVVHYAGDHSWAFLSGEAFDTDNGTLISMQTALTLDPTLRSIANLPAGWSARRAAVDKPWLREIDRDETE